MNVRRRNKMRSIWLIALFLLLTTNGGLTQIRLRFKLDDNNNAIANYLSLYSGNAAMTDRPQLAITYYVP